VEAAGVQLLSDPEGGRQVRFIATTLGVE
jgi:hypothetical protein